MCLRDGGQNGQLMRGIDPFDVKGRVGFGVTQLLCFFQHIGEITAFVTHFGQNEVTRAVNDTGNTVDAVGRQTFTNGLDDGNTTGDGGFVHHSRSDL